MTPPGGDPAAWLAGPAMLLVVVPVAVVAARLLTHGVVRLVAPLPADAWRYRVAEVATVLAAVALWWWEVRLQAQLPAAVASVEVVALSLRWAAHAILFLLLAAASWTDLRHRVIPDAITVPGVLGGLAWNTVLPGTLLPIATFVKRSFATPAVEPDVLAVAGGLSGIGLPNWLTGAAGLVITGLLFIVWWWFGMPPEGAAGTAAGGAERPSRGRLADPRFLVAIAGGAGLVTAWTVGGDHWTGLVTAVVGLTVSAGLVWATRAGASWALGREALGFGDVTLMAMAGAWLGWQACLLAIMLAVFIGLVHGITQLMVHSESELPFGPSLCLGIAGVVIAWQPLWAGVAQQFERPHEMALVAGLVIGLTAVTLWCWTRLRDRASPR